MQISSTNYVLQTKEGKNTKKMNMNNFLHNQVPHLLILDSSGRTYPFLLC